MTGGHVKPVATDRLATEEEVRRANCSSPRELLELWCESAPLSKDPDVAADLEMLSLEEQDFLLVLGHGNDAPPN